MVPVLRFRLRTLLIVVAVLAVPCAWVGQTVRWIRAREVVVRDQYGENPDSNIELVAYFLIDASGVSPAPRPDMPLGLRLLGQREIPAVFYKSGETPSKERLTELFPEAFVLDEP
jgi:hypothetical protein